MPVTTKILKELPRVNLTYIPVKDQKSQLLNYSVLEFAKTPTHKTSKKDPTSDKSERGDPRLVFLSNFIKTYNLLNFIDY